MEMVKKIGVRILLLGIIVTLSNFIYQATTYESDLRAEGNVLRKFERGVKQADILYFSASPNASIHPNDFDQRTLAQMMDDLIPSKKLDAVDTGGIHAGVYKKLIAKIPENSPVKTVVVNMNYRSFGISWIQSKLENAIQKQMVIYSNLPVIINRLLQGLNYYDALPDRERERIMLSHWKNDKLPFDAPRNTVTNWCAIKKWDDLTAQKRQLTHHYIQNFAFVLDDQNPRVKDFDEIVEICKEKKLRLIFVILPENLEECEKLVDKDLVDLMKSNKDWLVNRYTEKGAELIDCLDNVADSCFTERDFPSEHYNQIGRMIVAGAVAKTINQ